MEINVGDKFRSKYDGKVRVITEITTTKVDKKGRKIKLEDKIVEYECTECLHRDRSTTFMSEVLRLISFHSWIKI